MGVNSLNVGACINVTKYLVTSAVNQYSFHRFVSTMSHHRKIGSTKGPEEEKKGKKSSIWW